MSAVADLTDEALIAEIRAAYPVPTHVLDDAHGTSFAAWRGLTVRQPHASAIVGRPGGDGGPKDVENRSRNTHHRGPILIHAGQRFDHDHGVRGSAVGQWMTSGHAVTEWVFGAVIGMAVIEDSHQCDGSCSEWAEPGAWHWRLGERRALREPIGMRGALGLWKPPHAVLAEALGQFAADASHRRLQAVASLWDPFTSDDLLIGEPTMWRPAEGVA